VPATDALWFYEKPVHLLDVSLPKKGYQDWNQRMQTKIAPIPEKSF